MHIPRTQVQSSAIVSIAYTTESALDVEFTSGVTHRYFAVPRSTVEALLSADSKGAFLNRYVKPHFPSHRLGNP
jgi:hypothetical protein